MKSRIMYIELKTHPGGHDDRGPARIGRVTFSATGKTIYYQGKKFQSLKGAGFCGNYSDVDTGDEYWISGCKKNGQDRHWAGGGPVEIDNDVREEYWTEIRNQPDRKNKQFA
ncbi:MAG: 1-deoxy-D-xylulose-5-phosphate synthase [Planctomycetota bacterium]|nr:MAG: 1-deoxy-D-xylulose-5-phosphate synthase [Planctomycetota bacterium]